MKMMNESSKISLERGKIFSLVDAEKYRVTCHRGLLWITQDDELKDIVLMPGNSIEISHAGVTLINACKEAEISVQAPETHGLATVIEWLHNHAHMPWHGHGAHSGGSGHASA